MERIAHDGNVKMSDHVPKAVLININKFHKTLTNLEKALASLNQITQEQKNMMSVLERAELDVTVVSLVNSLYCLYTATLGKNPQDEDAVGIEFRRWKEVKNRLTQLKDLYKRPVLNSKVANAFVRNALFDVMDYEQSENEEDDSQYSDVDMDQNDEQY